MGGPVRINLDISGLLDYAKAGLDAFKEVKRVTSKVLNVGRKEMRQKISSEFQSRTGYLRRQARRVQTKAIVQQSEIYGRVAPLPRLMNIFERGATLAHGRGYLRPRPVVQPAADLMEKDGHRQFEELMKRVGKR